MARNLTAGMIAAYTAAKVKPIFLVQIECTSGTVYAWSGYGTLNWDGQNYLGVGTFGLVDVVGETTDLSAQGVNFSLSGVDAANIEIALDEIEQGLNAALYLGALDDSGALISQPYLLFYGLTDVPTVNEGPDNDCTISISVESRLIDLARSRERRYTTHDQQLDYPDDLGFDFVPGLQNANIRFGG